MHALGDTAWFVGLGAVAVTTALCSGGLVAVPRPGARLVAWLGAVAVAVGLLQFGWFVDHVFGLFAAPGTLLQAAWFVAVGATTTGRPPVAVVVAPTTRSPTPGGEAPPVSLGDRTTPTPPVPGRRRCHQCPRAWLQSGCSHRPVVTFAAVGAGLLEPCAVDRR